MHLCYIDESGTSDVPGTSSHFILAGIAIPIEHWKECDQEIEQIKKRYGLEKTEIHTAFMLRKYFEQIKIPEFNKMNHEKRRYEVMRLRNSELLRLQKSGKTSQYRQTKKNYKNTEKFIHLTYAERLNAIREIAQRISGWSFARLFAECLDKIYFDPARAKRSIGEQCFEQVVSRFETYLQITGKNCELPNYGLLIHDNNPTVAKKHTNLMKLFHEQGTLWTTVKDIIETPLFVDSQLTNMIQAADVCAYALRRYLENNEEGLFDHIFQRADRRKGKVEGVRHFTDEKCKCKICSSH